MSDLKNQKEAVAAGRHHAAVSPTISCQCEIRRLMAKPRSCADGATIGSIMVDSRRILFNRFLGGLTMIYDAGSIVA